MLFNFKLFLKKKKINENVFQWEVATRHHVVSCIKATSHSRKIGKVPYLPLDVIWTEILSFGSKRSPDRAHTEFHCKFHE